MVRTVVCKALLVLVLIVVPAAAQEQCMDCAEKETERFLVGQVQWIRTEALCADCPCTGGWTVEDEDVGYGCGVDIWDNPQLHFVGTHCNSSDIDEGCPEPPPPPDEIQNCTEATGCGSPIILDLGHENYQLTSVSGGVHFDLRNDGQKPAMAWTRLGVENAFLARDRNGNGQIDNGSELFGNYTRLRSGALAPNGFVALAELDGNDDGLINSVDAAWSKLLLWTDRNHDGFSTADELQRISRSVVSALATDYQTIRKRDQWGNLFRYKSRFWIQKNGTRHHRTYYDVFFQMAQ